MRPVTVLVPTFTFRPVRNTRGDAIRPIGLCLHVQDGENSPFGWFNNPTSGVSSNLWAGTRGDREQYVPLDVRAWAQGAGNSLYASIETEGRPDAPLTDLQLDSVAAAYAHGARVFGWPLIATDSPGQPGLITHAAGGQAWGGHTGCPGVLRAAQRSDILTRARALLSPSPPEVDVLAQEDVDRIAAAAASRVLAALQAQVFSVQPPIRQGGTGQVIGATYNKVGDLQGETTKIVDYFADGSPFAVWCKYIHDTTALTQTQITSALEQLAAIRQAVEKGVVGTAPDPVVASDIPADPTSTPTDAVLARIDLLWADLQVRLGSLVLAVQPISQES